MHFALFAGLVLAIPTATVVAQASGNPADTTRPGESRTALARQPEPLISRGHLLTLGVTIASTIAIEPFDQRIRAFVQSPHAQDSPTLNLVAKRMAFAGGPGPFVAGGVLFATGRSFGVDGLADAGLHLTEAVSLAATIDALGKGISGRELPNAPNDEAGDFSLGRGFHRHNGAFVSFPSGHTAAAFASAAVLTSETARTHPSLEWIVGSAAYAGASLVGLSRVYQNQHWASDLPLAALIGTWSGNALVRRQHDGNQHTLDRWLLGTTVAPSPRGGVLVGWSSSAMQVSVNKSPAERAMTMTMIVSSTSFAANGAIPKRFTCDGDDVSPPLEWAGVPAAARSLVLIMDDPDAPDPAAPKTTWVHWVLYNIPVSTTALAEGIKTFPAGTQSGLNDWKRTGYGGPCPPIGRHRYFHKLYALDTVLTGLNNPTKAEVEKAMAGHVVAHAELVGLYSH